MNIPKKLEEKRDELAAVHAKEYEEEYAPSEMVLAQENEYKEAFNAACNLLLPEIEKMREVLQHYSNEHENALWWPGVNRPGVEQNYGKYADQALAHIEEFLGEKSEGK